MVNGLDFYPTLLTLTGTKRPKDKNLDGCDLSDLLLKDPTNPNLAKNKNGRPRDTMVWHFPHSVAMESTIRVNGYKLVRNYKHQFDEGTTELELYQLYKTDNGKQVRVDIEEANNLTSKKPKITKELNERLSTILNEMDASYPYCNPQARRVGPEKKLVPNVKSHRQTSNAVKFTFTENGAQVIRADLIYSLNGGERYEEWFRIKDGVHKNNEISFSLPKGTTHYFLNLIDENNFLISYPQAPDNAELSKTKKKFAKHAIANKGNN
jgi:uncharacterized sulfatase